MRDRLNLMIDFTSDIVLCFGIHKDVTEKLFMVMEYVSLGSLDHILRQVKGYCFSFQSHKLFRKNIRWQKRNWLKW